MKHLRKRSFTLAGHRTSVALEDEFWAVLEHVAVARAVTLPVLLALIDSTRQGRPLASASRLAALDFASHR